jgi:putative aldouronate transport system substrate-binding protein
VVLERVLAFYNELMEPDIYNLLQYDIADRHYTLVEDQAKTNTESDLFQLEIRPLLSLQIGGPSTIDGLKPYPHDGLSLRGENIDRG